MSTSFSGSLPLLSTLFVHVFYYTDFMANKICMYMYVYNPAQYSYIMSFFKLPPLRR